MKNPSELVGKVVKIEDTQYLIDAVLSVSEEEHLMSVQKFEVTLITLDFLTEIIQDTKKEDVLVEIPKLKTIVLNDVTGFAFKLSEDICNAKLQIVKAFKYVSGLGLKEAKDIVDSMQLINKTSSYYSFKYEFPKNMFKEDSSLDDVQTLRIKWQDMMRRELQCNLSDISISIY